MAPKSILKNGSSSKPSSSSRPAKSNGRGQSQPKSGSASAGVSSSGKTGGKKGGMSMSVKAKSNSAKGGASKSRAVKDQVEDDDEDDDEEVVEGFGGSDDEDVDMGDAGAGNEGGDEELGTDEEIELAKGGGKSKKAGQKRKRTTTADDFGLTLTSLLGDTTSTKKVKPTKTSEKSTTESAETGAANAESTTTSAETTSSKPLKLSKPSTAQPILSLSRAKLPPSRAQLALERKAEEAVKKAKVEREEKARVTDVMEGWGHGEVGAQEFERGLRKVAQRGVIKLFNAILAASKTSENASLADQAGIREERKSKEKDNVLGRGGKERLTKEGFLDMVRKG